MRQSSVYVMRDQVRHRVSAIMQEEQGWQGRSAPGPWTPALLLASLLLANLLLAAMPA